VEPLCAAAGLSMGAAAVVHANFAAAVALLFVFDRRIAIRVAVWALLPMALASAFASHLAGHLTGIATNGGINFFLAHSDWAAASFPTTDAICGIVPRPNALRGGDVFTTSEHAWNDRLFYLLGLKSIASHPVRLLTDLRNVEVG
jgi:hypothetical protein